MKKTLSTREGGVFTHLGEGKTTSEIAKIDGLSPKTVQAYCERIKSKLGLTNGEQLRRAAVLAVNRAMPEGLALLLDRTERIEIRFIDATGKVIQSRGYRAE